MKVYIVQCEYATEDEREIKLHVFDTFDKAYQKFQALITEEINPENSWIGQLNWKDGMLPEDEYEFLNNETNTENEAQYWYVTNLDDMQYHTYLDLVIKDVL